MQAEHAYAELCRRVAAPETKSTQPPDDLSLSINQSYFLLRRWFAIVALVMPLALWIAGWAVHGTLRPNPSLSAYYYQPGDWARDFFVGALCVVGFFLYFYKGYTRTEDRVLNVAGVSAGLVALSPMSCLAVLESCSAQRRLFPDALFRLGTFEVTLHGLAAVTLFGLVGYVCIFQSRQTLQLIREAAVRARFASAYRLLGALMALLPVAVVVLNALSGQRLGEGIAVFLIEVFGITVFALFWLVKSREIAWILEQGAGLLQTQKIARWRMRGNAKGD